MNSDDRVFVSYSHRDSHWLEALRVHLAPLSRAGSVRLWSDRDIRAGADWRKEISDALSRASVAILLVSAHYLGSPFIAENELPPLLESARKGGLKILWIALSDCLYAETEIAKYQALNDPAKPLTSFGTRRLRDRALVAIATRIKEAVEDSRRLAPSLPSDPPERWADIFQRLGAYGPSPDEAFRICLEAQALEPEDQRYRASLQIARTFAMRVRHQGMIALDPFMEPGLDSIPITGWQVEVAVSFPHTSYYRPPLLDKTEVGAFVFHRKRFHALRPDFDALRRRFGEAESGSEGG